jgi:hypothetical protein
VRLGGAGLSAWRCACGYAAASREDLADHLGEQFIPADDAGAGGQAHAEGAREPDATGLARAGWECLGGFDAPDLAGFDAHLLAVFTPPSGIGADGRGHGQQEGSCSPERDPAQTEREHRGMALAWAERPATAVYGWLS